MPFTSLKAVEQDFEMLATGGESKVDNLLPHCHHTLSNAIIDSMVYIARLMRLSGGLRSVKVGVIRHRRVPADPAMITIQTSLRLVPLATILRSLVVFPSCTRTAADFCLALDLPSTPHCHQCGDAPRTVYVYEQAVNEVNDV